jgi:uncharacterized protein (DUF427 family)
MATMMTQHVMGVLGELRFQPTVKRIRVLAEGETVADTTRAVLVWEPRRVTPQYAVPAADVNAELVDAAQDEQGDATGVVISAGGPRVFDPRTSFGFHTVDGHPLTVRTGSGDRVGAGFRLADSDLDSLVVLDFDAFDWLEEEEPLVAHPRDPFHRIDVRRSSRQVRVELAGTVLAESERPRMLFETMLPERFYLPAEDVRLDLLAPTDTTTCCAYKGCARYWSYPPAGGEGIDVCWQYPDPLDDAEKIRGMVAFFNERVDLTIDGLPRERPITPWSRRSDGA